MDAGDGLCLHVETSGEGPPLVVLHGFTGSTETWESLRSVAELTHTVIAVDLPGHGNSSAPNDPGCYALTRFADDLLHVLDEVSVQRTAVLGYSMGGRAALRFALAHGDRVAALILESMSPGIVDEADRRARVHADNVLADAIESDGIEAFVNRWERLPIWNTQQTVPADVRNRLRAQRLENRQEGLANSLRGAGPGCDEPVHHRLGEVDAPTLLIAGALDSKYVEIATSMNHAMPNARLHIIPDAGHAAHFERPDAFASAVLAFLKDISRA
ncbi:MAG TPA: 2-succinyl-6-hydroxy-2,4-cyclohexadiene-1-carboxylate synthase [Gemmatimonadaceae bacterium]|nr:2-succinyl-6-hydroxy-2,4-cyclohexadiene-1-carboxylate synthase [Gemmatimonadaceae bacterium]